jgi:hypothetical protein
MLDPHGLDRPERLFAEVREPAAAVVLGVDQVFELLDFSLSAGAREPRTEESVQREDGEGILRRHQDGVKAATACSVMFRVPGQEPKSREELLQIGPEAAETVGILSRAEATDEAIAWADERLADPEYFAGIPEARVDECKRLIRSWQQLLRATSPTLTEAQRKKLLALAKALDARKWWEPRLPALLQELKAKAPAGARIALGLPEGRRIDLADGLRIREALREWTVVYPFVQAAPRRKPPKGATPEEVEKFLEEEEAADRPSTTACPELPFTAVPAAEWAAAPGTLVEAKWDAAAGDPTYRAGESEADEPGLEGLVALLEELEPEARAAIRLALPPAMPWSDAVLAVAAARLAGAAQVRVRAPAPR